MSEIATALRGLKAIADLSPLPYPKSLASLSLLIHQAASDSKRNATDIKRLASRVIEVTWAVVSVINDDPHTTGDGLVLPIGQLLRTLEEISQVATRKPSSRLSRILNGVGDAGIVQRCEADLERCVSMFLMRMNSANIKLTSQISEKGSTFHDAFGDMIARAYRDQANLIHSNDRKLTGTSDIQDRSQSLPPAPQIFFGRGLTVGSVVAQLCQPRQAHVAILGAGGIGKTTVALTVLHHPEVVSKFGKNRYFVSCESALDSIGLLAALAELLSLQSKDVLTELSRLFRSLDEPIVVLLDNLETPWEQFSHRQAVEDVLSTLVAIPNLNLLVTLRGAERPNGVVWTRPCLLPLDKLDLEDSRNVFRAISDTPADDPHLDSLLDVLDHVPLAVTLMANLAQSCSCAVLHTRWQEEKTAMLTRGIQSRISSVDVSIQLSLSSERLKSSPQAIPVLQGLSLLPDGVSESELLSIMGHRPRISSAVSCLRQVALVYVDASDRLRILSPIREYVLLNIPLDYSDFTSIQSYFLDLIRTAQARDGRFDDREQVSKLKSQIGNVCSVLRYALEAENPIREVLATSLKLPVFLGTAVDSEQALVASVSAAARRIGDKKSEADCIVYAYGRRADRKVSQDLKELENAMSMYTQLQDLEDPDVLKSRARCLANIGDCHHRVGQRQKAIHLKRDAIRLYGQCSDYWGEGNELVNIARIYQISGQIPQAVHSAQEAVAIATTHSLPMIKAAAHSILGAIYLARSTLPKAAVCFEQASRAMTPVFQDSALYANNLYHIGCLHLEKSQLQLANKTFRDACTLYARQARTGWLASATSLLGLVQVMQSNLDEGSAQIYVALTKFAEFQWRSDQGQCLVFLATAELRRQNFATAWSHLLEARRCYRLANDIGVKRDGEALKLMGDVAMKSNDLMLGLRLYVTSCVVFWKTSYRLGMADALVKIGNVLGVLGEKSDAAACCETAMGIVEGIGAQRHIAECLWTMADIALDKKDYAAATRLLTQGLSAAELAEDEAVRQDFEIKILSLRANGLAA